MALKTCAISAQSGVKTVNLSVIWFDTPLTTEQSATTPARGAGAVFLAGIIMKTMFLAAAAALIIAAPAGAQVVVDGSLDAAYGAAKSTVAYSPTAPRDNFGTPTGASNAIGYSIYLTSDATKVYGFLQTNASPGAASVFAGANLYFGLNGAGSNLGFEIGTGGVTAFIPGGAGPVALSSNLYSTAFNGNNVVEFALDNSLFTGPIAGLAAPSTQVYPTNGSNVRLNLSQAFGYSVAGGATDFGANRLGVVTIGGNITAAVPEPATWAMMIAGFGLVGGAMRRRKTSVAFA